MAREQEQTDTIEAPPFLKTWPRVYSAIVSYLALLVAVLYIITKVFRY
jgi:hypothetical protein